MKTSELIAALQESLAEHGDMPVGFEDTEWPGSHCSIDTVYILNSIRPSEASYTSTQDDDELGDRFVGLSTVHGPDRKDPVILLYPLQEPNA